MFVKFSLNAELLNVSSVWATMICCLCFHLVHLARRSQFQLLCLVLLTTLSKPEIGSDSDFSRYNLLCFFYMLVASFCVSVSSNDLRDKTRFLTITQH